MTLSYESVLRAMLMKTYYEKKIDSIDDVLAADREVIIYGDGIWDDILTSDPRLEVKALARRTKTWSPDISERDLGLEWLVKGYPLTI